MVHHDKEKVLGKRGKYTLVSAWTEISSIFDENYFFARRGKKHRHILRYGEYF